MRLALPTRGPLQTAGSERGRLRRDGSRRRVRGRLHAKATLMRFALLGLIVAALVFALTGGHMLLLPLFFVLPLGGLFGHRRSRLR